MSLPLLEYTSSLFPHANLSNTLVIACQHILGTTYDLFDELFKKGLKPENTYLLGKCYSTNDDVFKRFRDRGVFQAYIDDFVKSIKVDFHSFEKVIILDDGGFLLSYANDFMNIKNVVGIEQTSSGFSKIKDISLNYPIVNVARSKAKLEYESPLIAQLVIEKIESHFLSAGITDPNILIIGQGYIGKNISTLLKEKYHVTALDISQDNAHLDKSSWSEFDVIIGATGKNVIQPGDFSTLKAGVALISVSSSDREFSAAYLRALLPKNQDCHANIDTGKITLLNSGFPINFDGKEHSMPPEQAQLTRSLLLAGVCHGFEMKELGIIDLDMKIQESIIKEFSNY
jgi:S-adenosylhomocysteine hydrolase